MWNRGAGVVLPPQLTLWHTAENMSRQRPWLPPPQLAVSLWSALKTILHREHAVAATLPHLISIWTLLPPWPRGAPSPAPWPPPLSLWMSQSTLASSPLTRGPRVAPWSWPPPPHLNTLALSAEEVTWWRGQWLSSVVQGAAAVCRALTHPVDMVACTVQPMAAATMTQRWRTQTWRGNYKDSGRSKEPVFYCHTYFMSLPGDILTCIFLLPLPQTSEGDLWTAGPSEGRSGAAISPAW